MAPLSRPFAARGAERGYQSAGGPTRLETRGQQLAVLRRQMRRLRAGGHVDRRPRFGSCLAA
eukprot:7304446-Lingulodinium_polyedra.AAC.1